MMKSMRISKSALKKMPVGSRLRKRLAFELDVDRTTVDRWIEKNEDDGDLTKIKALHIISEETGMEQSEILVEVAA